MGRGFAGAPQSLLAELGEDSLSQNERKGGSKSKFMEINRFSTNGKRFSGGAGYENVQKRTGLKLKEDFSIFYIVCSRQLSRHILTEFGQSTPVKGLALWMKPNCITLFFFPMT